MAGSLKGENLKQGIVHTPVFPEYRRTEVQGHPRLFNETVSKEREEKEGRQADFY